MRLNKTRYTTRVNLGICFPAWLDEQSEQLGPEKQHESHFPGLAASPFLLYSPVFLALGFEQKSIKTVKLLLTIMWARLFSGPKQEFASMQEQTKKDAVSGEALVALANSVQSNSSKRRRGHDVPVFFPRSRYFPDGI